MVDPCAPSRTRNPLRALALAAFMAATLPSAASAVSPEPSAAPGEGAQTVEDFKAALSDIKRRLAEQRDSLQSGDQAAAVAEEAKAARGQIERLTRSMADLRRERDALRGQLLASRGSAEALQAKLTDAEARMQATAGGAEEQLRDLQQQLDQAKTAQSAAESRLGEAQQQLATELDQLKKQVEQANATAAGKDRDLAQATAQLVAQKSESARLEEALSVARSLDARLGDEVNRTRSALAAANTRSAEIEKEVAGLREVAASTVDEARSLGEQLMAALADNRQLAAALSDLRAGKDLLDTELEDTAPAPAAGPSPATSDAAGAPEEGLPRLAAIDGGTPPASVRTVLARLETGGDASPDMGSTKRRHPAVTQIDGAAFASGSAELRPEAAPSLAIVAAFIRSQPPGRVRVVGYTDTSGDAAENLQLSTHRAQAVRDYLVRSLDLAPQHVVAEGRGEADPVASNETADGRRTNRRVEVRIEP
ncbi:MAG: OmpA family protein [Geminicoccaceae bacterium]